MIVEALLAQLGMELRLTLRRGENLLVTLGLPLTLLIFFGTTDFFALGRPGAIAFLTPGLLALAIMSTGMVSLGIATAYERHYGVLKRLGGTPLTRPRLIAAKILAVLVVEIAQALLLGGTAAVFFDWRPAGAGLLPALGLGILGTVAFAGLGLALAGRLRAEATLAAANGLYLLLLLGSGLFVPLDRLPAAAAALAPYSPAAALAAGLRATLTGAAPAPTSVAVLLVWAVGAVTIAALTFRWE